MDVRWIDLRDDDVEGLCTSTSKTLEMCGRRLPFDEALAIADSALRDGFPAQELRALADAAQGPGSSRLRRVAQHADLERPTRSSRCYGRSPCDVPGLDVEPQARLRGAPRPRRTTGPRRPETPHRGGVRLLRVARGSRSPQTDVRRYDLLVANGWTRAPLRVGGRHAPTRTGCAPCSSAAVERNGPKPSPRRSRRCVSRRGPRPALHCGTIGSRSVQRVDAPTRLPPAGDRPGAWRPWSSSTMVVSSKGSLPGQHAGRAGRGRGCSVQWPTRMVATELPAKLVTARASDMKRSMPTIRPTPSSSSGRCEDRPPASVARPAPVTPGGALRGDDHEEQQRDLLAERQRRCPARRR